MIGAWRRLDEQEYREVWDEFHRRFEFAPSLRQQSIREPSPSVTFDIRPVWDEDRPGFSDAAIKAIDASARLNFLAEFGDDVELVVLDWQHISFRLRPGDVAADPSEDYGFLLPTVVPDGDYYIYATPDLSEGTFGHPWLQSLCVFGPRMTRSLGGELRTWLPVLREHGSPQSAG